MAVVTRVYSYPELLEHLIQVAVAVAVILVAQGLLSFAIQSKEKANV